MGTKSGPRFGTPAARFWHQLAPKNDSKTGPPKWSPKAGPPNVSSESCMSKHNAILWRPSSVRPAVFLVVCSSARPSTVRPCIDPSVFLSMFCLALSCFVLSCLVVRYLICHFRVLSRLASSRLVPCRLVMSNHVLSSLIVLCNMNQLQQQNKIKAHPYMDSYSIP